MKKLLGVFLMVTAISNASLAVESETAQWRKDVEEALKQNWLTVVALDWLKEGNNSIGSAVTSKVKLPPSVAAELGTIRLKNNKAEIEFADVKDVKVDGKPAKAKKTYILQTDKSKNKTVVEIGSGATLVQFFIIDRPNGLGVRVKDQNAQTLKDFKGLQWWDENPKQVIQGEWKAFKEPRILRVPDILGNTYDEKITGSVVFKIDGKDFELFPTRTGDTLFFVFKDTSSGKENYGTGRFLEASVDKAGKVVLDFNRAYNPPCAQIKFATCPMPPPENNLKVSILAGEKKPTHSH